MKYSPLILVLLHLANLTFAQGKYYQIDYTNNETLGLAAQYGNTDSAGFTLETQKIKNGLLANGFLLANIDKLYFEQDTLQAVINVGKKYKWQALGTHGIAEEMLSRVGYREKDFFETEFSGKELNRLITRLLDEAGNSGYPFANLQLQEIQVAENSVMGILNYEPGPVIYYDSLTLGEQNFIKPKFLESYLGIQEGTLFQIKNIAQIEKSINRLPYCKLKDSIGLSFQNNLSNISFKVQPIKANKIDALIGFLPNNQGLLISGNVNLQLQNLFKSGKELSFLWNQFQVQSQKLYFLYKHPNLFRSALGISLNFDMLKQDSAFFNTNFSMKGYYKYKQLEVSLATIFKSSRSLSTPTDAFKLPQLADYSMQLIGARAAYNGLGNNSNPRKGTATFLDFQIGNKKINKNPDIAGVVYDGVNLNPVQIEVLAGAEINHPLVGPLVVHADIEAGAIFNNDKLFINDLLRLGGVNSLRGFNDLEFFVSSYTIARFEARVLLNAKSRLFLFYDKAFTNNVVANIKVQPYGFGAGMMLNTSQGDLQLVYALGVSDQQSLSLSHSKIHIGYVARF